MSLSGIRNLKNIDDLAGGESFIHKLHPAVKTLTTFLFIVIVMSFNPYKITPLAPFFLYPVVILSISGIPLKQILKPIIPVMPFIIFVAIFNPFFDRIILARIGNITITRGMISFFAIMIRSLLAISSVFLLIATTGMYRVGHALQLFKVPPIFITQIIFTYRYLFVLLEEIFTMQRAALLRSPANKHVSLKDYRYLLSSFIGRSIDKSSRIYTAMLARGFNGNISLQKIPSLKFHDIIFLSCWCIFFITARIWNFSEITGTIILKFTKSFL